MEIIESLPPGDISFLSLHSGTPIDPSTFSFRLEFVQTERLVRNSVCSLAPVIVLIAGLTLARGQMVETDVSWLPWWLRVVAQAPVTMPLSETSVVLRLGLQMMDDCGRHGLLGPQQGN
jgi:hypothetical protein